MTSDPMHTIAGNGIRRRDVLVGASALGLTLSLPAGSALAKGGANPQGTKAWHKSPYRLVQFNMREPDIRHDPVAMIERVRDFGANVVLISVGGIVAFYPTALQYHYRNPYMASGQDFVRDTIAAARAVGISVVGRFDFTKAMKPAFDAHPEWFSRNADGSPRVYASTYAACPNGAWSRDYSALILKEALGRYDLDGIFFNGAGYAFTDYSNRPLGPCQCQNCRIRFREMYGEDLPKTSGFSDPVWPQYLEFQERTSRETNDATRKVIRSIRPHCAILGRGLEDDVLRGELQRRVDRAAPEWAYQSGEQSREMQAAAPGMPFSAASTAHVDYPWRQTLETGPCHVTRFAQQLGTGAQLDLYLMGAFEDQDDHRFEPPVAALFQWYARNAEHYRGLVPNARIALYSNPRMARYGGLVPVAKLSTAAWRGAYSALVDRRIPFWFVSGEAVSAGVTKLTPASFDVIILPHVVMLGDAEAKALDDFVAAGGTVVSTGQTGAYDPMGKRRLANALQSSPIARYTETADCRGWSFDAARAEKGLDLGGARIPADGNYYRAVFAPGARNLLPRAPDQPFGPPEMAFAPDNAPTGAEPGIIARPFGKGISIHLPWAPDGQYYRDGMPDHAGLLSALIEHYAPPPAGEAVGRGAC